MRKKPTSSGFTLVELSIVLVIIGLIIGGVLSGRQIMENAEVTNALNSIQAYEAQFQTYTQNYGAMPGDDPSAQTHFPDAGIPSEVAVSAGTLQGAFDSTTTNDETRLLWADLRAAGLVKGTGNNTAQPANPFGGIYGFQHGALGITTNVLCLSNVPGDAAVAIDSRLDDGNSATGAVQSILTSSGEPTAGATPAATYDSSQTYTMCVKM
jgi:prepilin-type N-terminal cleavage/methylation domain-containing protein